MNASGMIECSDESSVQIVRSSETPNLNGSSQSAGWLIFFHFHLVMRPSFFVWQAWELTQHWFITICFTFVLADRYTRLTESRSITPSPPPTSTSAISSALKQQHIPSLSPISSSAESTPSSKSPKVKVKRAHSSMSPTVRAKTIITSKISTITSILNNKAHSKKVTSKLKCVLVFLDHFVQFKTFFLLNLDEVHHDKIIR